MLQLYKYLYYRLYSWNLKKWGEIDGPQYSALFAVTFMMCLNFGCLFAILDVLNIIDLVNSHDFVVEKRIVEQVFIVSGLIAYFWLVHNKKYLKLEEKYGNEPRKKRMQNALFLWIYVILSFGVLILLASL